MTLFGDLVSSRVEFKLTHDQQVLPIIERLLIEARALLEKGWVAGHYAVDDLGTLVDVQHPRACKFCLGGAVQCVTRRPLPPMYRGLLDETYRGLFDETYDAIANLLCHSIAVTTLGSTRSMAGFNDSHTQQDVLDVVDSALSELIGAQNVPSCSNTTHTVS